LLAQVKGQDVALFKQDSPEKPLGSGSGITDAKPETRPTPRPRRQIDRKDGRQLHRLTVYLPPALDRRLRVFCAETDLSISEAMSQALERWLDAGR